VNGTARFNEQFGWIARNIGGVDGDGVPDIVTSAPTRVGGPNAGRVYVYSTKASFFGPLTNQLRTGVEGAGDTNHDGIPDVVASAPGAGHSVFPGKMVASARVRRRATGRPGRRVCVGDLNHDGYAICVEPDNAPPAKAQAICLLRQRMAACCSRSR
jgi:hypothetical protein